MDQKLKIVFLLLVCFLTRSVSYGQDVAPESFIENGIAYDIISEEDKTVAVTHTHIEESSYTDGVLAQVYEMNYSGVINIPETVKHDGVIYKVTEIGKKAFQYAENMTELTIPKTVVFIDEHAFLPYYDEKKAKKIEYHLEKLTFADGNDSLHVEESNAYDLKVYVKTVKALHIGRYFSRKDYLYGYLPCRGVETITFGSNISTIQINLFAHGPNTKDWLNLTSLTIPATVKKIEAFDEAQNVIPAYPYTWSTLGLKELIFEDSDEELEMGFGARELSTVETLYLGRNLVRKSGEVYGASPFNNAKSITMGDKVTKIIPGLFNGCGSLTDIKLSANITEIGEKAFSCCTSLTSFEVPSGVTTLPRELLLGCTKLKTITLPEGLKKIGYRAFVSCYNLESLTIPGSVTDIEEEAFCLTGSEKPTNFKLLAFADGDEELNIAVSGRFMSIPGTLYIGRNIPVAERTADGGGLFFQDVNYVEFGDNIIYVPQYMFSGYSSLKSVKFGKGIKTFGEGAFFRSGLESVEIPSAVEYIPYRTFEDCKSLKTVTLNEGLKYIYAKAFYGCKSLEEVKFPSTLELIDWDAFNGCEELLNLVFPEALKSIGTKAFYFDGKISSVEVPWREPFEIIGRNSSDKTFDSNVFDNAYLLVPNGTVDIYKRTNGWKDFKNILVSSYNVWAETTEGGTVTALEKTAKVNQPIQGIIKSGKDLIVTISPEEGYELTSLTINDEERVNEVVSNQITISKVETDLTIKAIYKKKSFAITASVSEGGQLTILGKTVEDNQSFSGYVEWDEDIEVTVTESEDCLLAAVTVNGTDITTEIKDGKFIIKDVREAKDIVATFAQSVLKHLRITDGKTYDQTEAFTTQKLTYKRTFPNTNEWDILVLPVSLDYADWKDQLDIAYIYDVNVYDENGDGDVDKTEIEAVIMSKGSTLANYPYLVRSKKSGEVIVTRGETMVQKPTSLSLDCSNTIMKFTITGTYEATPASTVSANKWYVMKDGVWTTGSNDLGTMRAYLQVEKKVGSYSQTQIPPKISTKIDGSGTSGVFGDLNGDGVVNAADHVKLSDIIMKQ